MAEGQANFALELDRLLADAGSALPSRYAKVRLVSRSEFSWWQRRFPKPHAVGAAGPAARGFAAAGHAPARGSWQLPLSCPLLPRPLCPPINAQVAHDLATMLRLPAASIRQLESADDFVVDVSQLVAERCGLEPEQVAQRMHYMAEALAVARRKRSSSSSSSSSNTSAAAASSSGSGGGSDDPAAADPPSDSADASSGSAASPSSSISSEASGGIAAAFSVSAAMRGSGLWMTHAYSAEIADIVHKAFVTTAEGPNSRVYLPKLAGTAAVAAALSASSGAAIAASEMRATAPGAGRGQQVAGEGAAGGSGAGGNAGEQPAAVAAAGRSEGTSAADVAAGNSAGAASSSNGSGGSSDGSDGSSDPSGSNGMVPGDELDAVRELLLVGGGCGWGCTGCACGAAGCVLALPGVGALVLAPSWALP